MTIARSTAAEKRANREARKARKAAVAHAMQHLMNAIERELRPKLKEMGVIITDASFQVAGSNEWTEAAIEAILNDEDLPPFPWEES